MSNNTTPFLPFYKHCRKCDRDLPKTEGYFFVRTAEYGDGFRTPCKECTAKRSTQYYAENKERMTKASGARYYRNRPKRDVQIRAWRKANPEKVRQHRRAGYARHAERNRNLTKEYARKHPEKTQEWCARRRARILETQVEKLDYNEIIERDKSICHICGLFTERKDLEIDHIIALARGGTHTKDNVAVSHSRCNRAKHAKPLEVVLDEIRSVLPGVERTPARKIYN